MGQVARKSTSPSEGSPQRKTAGSWVESASDLRPCMRSPARCSNLGLASRHSLRFTSIAGHCGRHQPWSQLPSLHPLLAPVAVTSRARRGLPHSDVHAIFGPCHTRRNQLLYRPQSSGRRIVSISSCVDCAKCTPSEYVVVSSPAASRRCPDRPAIRDCVKVSP